MIVDDPFDAETISSLAWSVKLEDMSKFRSASYMPSLFVR